MAVTFIEEIPNGMSGEINAEFERTYRRTFLVETDSPYTGPVAIRSALFSNYGVAIGVHYVNGDNSESDSDAYCVRISEQPVAEADDGVSWHVTVEYGPATPHEENPLNEPAEVSIEGRDFERVVDRDIEDNPILNTAGDPFNPGIVKEDDRVIITISRNEAFVDYATIDEYYNTVNSTTFLNYFPPRTVRMLRPRLDRRWHQNIGFYWRVNYQFEIKNEIYEQTLSNNNKITLGQGWDSVVLSAGFRERSDEGRLKTIVIDGQPAQEPVLLDEDGKKMIEEDDPVYLSYKIYREKDFNDLNFGVI